MTKQDIAESYEFVTPKQYALMRGVTVTTVYRWIRNGLVQGYRFGERLLRINLKEQA